MREQFVTLNRQLGLSREEGCERTVGDAESSVGTE